MISVIIPTYNREATILRSIESVLNQSIRELELIIVDDCSSDNTEKIIADIKDNRLRYIKHESNSGACAARNTGIDAAIGSFIAFQDSDDEWHLDKLEKQLAVFEKSDVDIVFCKMQRTADVYPDVFPKRFSEGILNNHNDLMGISTQTILAKRSVFNYARFDTKMPRLQDLELMMRLSREHTIYCLDEPLVNYYVSDDAISTSNTKFFEACKIIFEKYPEIHHEYPELCRDFCRLLIEQSEAQEKQLKKEMLSLSMKYSNDYKNIARYILAKLNIYLT